MKRTAPIGILFFIILWTLLFCSCSQQTYPPNGDNRSDSTYENYYEGYYETYPYTDYFLMPYSYMPYGYFYNPYYYPSYHYHYHHYYPHNYNYHYFKPIPGYQPRTRPASSGPDQVARYHGNAAGNQYYRQPAPAARPQPTRNYSPHTTMPVSRPQMRSSGGGRAFRR